MAKKTKLELTWIGKENRPKLPKLEPRVLIEAPAKSYHAPHRVRDNDLFDNRLIFGDNLLALKALEQEFAGRIKCIYIDPPYNTGSAFEHYDDGIEHSLWLSLIRDRLELLRTNAIRWRSSPASVRSSRWRLSEYVGESYFAYLSKLDDLVLLMDESHRYRASAGVRAINELKPILGLELTATPRVERGARSEPFKNVIYSYPLSSALDDGFVKEPAVATRENFDASNYDEAGLERLKLEDGIRVHENTKVELEVFARQNERKIVSRSCSLSQRIRRMRTPSSK